MADKLTNSAILDREYVERGKLPDSVYFAMASEIYNQTKPEWCKDDRDIEIFIRRVTGACPNFFVLPKKFKTDDLNHEQIQKAIYLYYRPTLQNYHNRGMAAKDYHAVLLEEHNIQHLSGLFALQFEKAYGRPYVSIDWNLNEEFQFWWKVRELADKTHRGERHLLITLFPQHKTLVMGKWQDMCKEDIAIEQRNKEFTEALRHEEILRIAKREKAEYP